MKNFLIFIFLILVATPSYSQSLLPKTLKIDFSNPKAPEYRKRYKEYKDSIKTLSKLNKKALRLALKEFDELPKANKRKTNLKNLESDFKEYKSMIKEVDSLKYFHQTIDNIKVRENMAVKNSEEAIARAKRLQYNPVAEWLNRNEEEFIFSDSTLSFSQKIKETIANNEYGKIVWKELNIDPQVFLEDYNKYGEYWKEDETYLAEQKDKNVAQQHNEVTARADEHFGSYDNYVLAKEKAGEIESLLQEAKGYTQSIEALIKGNLDSNDKVASALKARAMKISAMRETSKQLGTLESAQQSMKEQIEEMRYKADLQSQYEEHIKEKSKDDLMQQAIARSKGLASKHFKGHEEELAKAQKGLDDYKSGVFNFKNSDNIKVLNKNSMKGKSLGERLVIGGYLQINRNNDYSAIDLSPQFGYKWTKNYLWGIGGTYRFKISESDLSLVRNEEIYGGRGFMEYSVGKLFAHGEYEMISHAKADPQTDIVRRINSPGALAGLGINYNFMKDVNGNIMVLYNFLYDRKASPYQHPIVLRFGFSLGK